MLAEAPTPQKAHDRWLPLIPAGLGAVLVLMGAAAIGIGYHQRDKAQAMRSWPTTQATIISSGFTTNRRPGDSRVERREVISFSYQVDGKSYSITNMEWIGYTNDVGPIEPQYPPGATARVYYDPRDPSDASLSNEREAPFAVLVGVGVGCLLVSAPFWYLAARWLRRRRPT